MMDRQLGLRKVILRSHRVMCLVGLSLFLTSCGTEQAANKPKPSELELPEVEVPKVKVPEVEVPEIKIPTIEIPKINVPEITIPEIEVRQNSDYFIVTLPAEILFDFDQATLRPDALTALEQVKAAVISHHPNAAILVAGHTDNKGSRSYNHSLSERRADAVKHWLISTGNLNESSIEARGYGETQPVAANTLPDGTDNPPGRQQNRRVELIIQRLSHSS